MELLRTGWSCLLNVCYNFENLTPRHKMIEWLGLGFWCTLQGSLRKKVIIKRVLWNRGKMKRFYHTRFLGFCRDLYHKLQYLRTNGLSSTDLIANIAFLMLLALMKLITTEEDFLFHQQHTHECSTAQLKTVAEKPPCCKASTSVYGSKQEDYNVMVLYSKV